MAARGQQSHSLRGRILCGVFAVALMAGCTGARSVEPTPNPTPSPAPTPIATPYLENPVHALYAACMEAYAPMEAEWAASDRPAAFSAHLDKIMTVERHMQRMQYFFAAISRLQHSSVSEEGTWEALLTGPLSGTGSIAATEDGGATFTCSYWSAGRIRGTVKTNMLHGDWQTAYTVTITPYPEIEDGGVDLATRWETIKSARIWREVDNFYIAVQWNEENTPDALLLIAPAAMYYADGLADVYAPGADPLSWAQWYYSNQLFKDNTPNTEVGGA
ncbi:hypothetical protein LJC07_02755 [Christensenellaceae bacterium OttesenSCG-928-L17]|nr:hypothetical protein [Christensenellaceae bacterium OttesenSCG-928-L17]